MAFPDQDDDELIKPVYGEGPLMEKGDNSAPDYDPVKDIASFKATRSQSSTAPVSGDYGKYANAYKGQTLSSAADRARENTYGAKLGSQDYASVQRVTNSNPLSQYSENAAAGMKDAQQNGYKSTSQPYYGNSGKFISFDRILGANKGSVEQSGKDINAKIRAKGEGAELAAQGAVRSSMGDVNNGMNAINHNGTDFSKNLSPAAATPQTLQGSNFLQDFISSKKAVKDTARNEAIAAQNPNDAFTQDASGFFQGAKDQAASVGQDIRQFGTDGGLAGFLKAQTNPGYTQQQATLDDALLRGGAGKQFEETQNRFGNLDKYISGQQGKAQNFINENKAEVDYINSTRQKMVEDKANAEKARVEGNAATAAEAERKRASRAKYDEYTKRRAEQDLTNVVEYTSPIDLIMKATGNETLMNKITKGLDVYANDWLGTDLNHTNSRAFGTGDEGFEVFDAMTSEDWAAFEKMRPADQDKYVAGRMKENKAKKQALREQQRKDGIAAGKPSSQWGSEWA